MAAQPKVLAPVPTSLNDLEDVVSIMNKLQLVSASTTQVYVSEATVVLKHSDTTDHIGTVLVSADGDEYTFVPGTSE